MTEESDSELLTNSRQAKRSRTLNNN